MHGREKLGFNDDDGCRVFDESDGTEIDDDDVLLSYNKGSIFVIGKEWKCEHSRNELVEHMELQEDQNAAEAMDDYRDVAGCSKLTGLVKENVNSNCAGYDDDIGNDVANNEKEISNKELSNEMEKESLHSNSTKNDTKDDKIPMKRKMCNELKETGGAVFKQAKSITEKLTGEKYRNAKLKNLKVYTEEEINAAPSDMEKTRRRFWNEKAEQVTTKKKTAGLDKLTLIGIIDVSWTMRKTSLIEDESRKVLDDEEILLKTKFSNQKSSQKKQTIPKNLERMAAAHAVLEKVNEEMEKGRELMKNVSMKKKEELKEEFIKKKVHLDASYTELKRAQDAALKAINGKKKLLHERLNSKHDAEVEASTSTEHC